MSSAKTLDGADSVRESMGVLHVAWLLFDRFHVRPNAQAGGAVDLCLLDWFRVTVVHFMQT